MLVMSVCLSIAKIQVQICLPGINDGKEKKT